MVVQRIAIDRGLVLPGLALSILGLAVVYSAGQTDVPTVAYHAWRSQLVWLGVSIVVAYAATRWSIRFVDWLTTPMYIFSLFLLVLVLVPGFGSGGGPAASVKAWLTIGGKRIGQPAEFAKLATVLMLAQTLAARREPVNSLFGLSQPLLIVGIPCVLVLLEPELGTAIVFVGILFGMLFWAGIERRLLALVASPMLSLVLSADSRWWGAWFLLLIALVIWYRPYLVEGVGIVALNVIVGVIAPLAWEHMKPYQQNRLRVFLNPAVDPRAAGYHVIQLLVAIGSGGWSGRGYLLGPQKRLAFLPEQYTDFIFAVVGEELGFIGVTVALLLFLALILRIARVAERGHDPFASLVAFGLLSNFVVHVFENVGMTIGFMPVTGIPLPFFSYGGSFMVASWLAIGILVRISAEGRGNVSATRLL